MRRDPRLAVVGSQTDRMTALRVGLEDYGFEVVTVAEPSSALDELVEAAPDLICLGPTSQGEDGLALYTELTHDPALSRCPVVILEGQGSGEESFSDLAAAAGVPAPAGVLGSPFDVDELVRTANVLLGRPLGVAP